MFKDVPVKHGAASVLASVRPVNCSVGPIDDRDFLVARLDSNVRFVLGALGRVGRQVDTRVNLALLLSVRLELLYEIAVGA